MDASLGKPATQKMALACEVTWLLPAQLESDPDFDDEGEDGVLQALDNLTVRISLPGSFSFTTSRRFTIQFDKNDDLIMAYPDAEWPWDAHHELSFSRRRALSAIEDFAPEKLICPNDFLLQLKTLF